MDRISTNLLTHHIACDVLAVASHLGGDQYILTIVKLLGAIEGKQLSHIPCERDYLMRRKSTRCPSDLSVSRHI